MAKKTLTDKQRIENLEKENNDLKEQIDDLWRMFKGMGGGAVLSMSDIDEEVGYLMGKTEKLELRIDDLEEEKTNLENRINELESK